MDPGKIERHEDRHSRCALSSYIPFTQMRSLRRSARLAPPDISKNRHGSIWTNRPDSSLLGHTEIESGEKSRHFQLCTRPHMVIEEIPIGDDYTSPILVKYMK